jgi:DNA (cytosine-5)-methyltransferase 3A
MNKGINVLSVCDGISCAAVALQRAGIIVNNYYASEIDKHAIKVSQSNWPNIKQVGDMCALDTSKLGAIDLLVGGTPCQSISNLGDGTGLEGKSGLFWEYVRIKNELNPKWWMLENVSGNKKAIDEISKVLGVEPIRINSSLVSAQKRDRLYWTNIPNIEQPQDLGINLKDILQPGIPELSILTPGRARWVTSEKGQQCFDKRYAVLNPIKANCLTARSDGSWNSNYVTRGDQITRLTPVEYERLQTLPDNYTDCIRTSERYKSIGNAWTVDAVAHILKNISQEMLTQDGESLTMDLTQDEYTRNQHHDQTIENIPNHI